MSKEALAEQPAQQYSATSDHRLMETPEFFTHSVEQPYDWSEWVCPDPKGYLMKCCDCGLVHEAEFGVVRYKSETEREDCEPVDDPNLQAVFRMRRSEQWSPKDTAHRAGGLPIEQPAQQEPVAWRVWRGDAYELFFSKYAADRRADCFTKRPDVEPLYTTPQPQRKPLTDEQWQIIADTLGCIITREQKDAIEAAHGIKENT